MAGAITYPITDDHPAIDIACRNGAEVRAAHDGVGRPFWDGRMGWTFQLAGGSGFKSSYSHLKTAAQQGHHKRGDVIGLCGNTGTWSTGTHLHFAMEPVSKLRQFHAFAPPLPDQAPLHQPGPACSPPLKILGSRSIDWNAVVPPTNSPSTTEERNACALPKRSIPIPNFWKRW